MHELVAAFAALPSVRRVLEAIRPGTQRAAGGLWGSSAALLLAALRAAHDGPIVVLTEGDAHSDEVAADLMTFGAAATVLPGRQTDVDGGIEALPEGRRLAALRGLLGRHDFLLVASLEALLQPAPGARELSRGHLRLQPGQRLVQDRLLQDALAAGLRRVPVVLAPGEVSQRGDVLDLFPLGAAAALRLEFADELLESMREFDPGTQLSLGARGEADVVLGGRQPRDKELPAYAHGLVAGALWIRHEPLRIDERQRLLAHVPEFVAGLQGLFDSIANYTRLDVAALPSHDLDVKILSAGSSAGSGEADPQGRLRAVRGLHGAVWIFCRSDDELTRLQEIFAHRGIDLVAERVTLRVGALRRGFRVPDLGLTVLSNVEFAGVPAAARVVRRPPAPSRAIASFFELRPGDLVVHAAHGIARFAGIELVERGDSREDHLRLEFHGDVQLLVPASKIHLVQKYVGAGSAAPALDRLGGRGFQRRKEEVQQSLFDLAGELLEVQAQRGRVQRPPYPGDTLEDAFLDGFPFQDTPDQATAWREIRADLEREQPMDRLLCGDVGFGKTEVALRAAFKVAITGRQVAVLAPTTVLADQHQRVFAARMAPHGLRVELLTRYTHVAVRKRLLADLRRGQIDVLVGTHALLGKEVEWRQLGLLVVDEEQRFGVRHKEQLKRLRVTVDVLALSATPIPRTLHASLLGLRAISTLNSPPPGRQDVDTRLCFRDPDVMREALHRELSRQGQVFVLHNRVQGLSRVAGEIERLAPQARVAIGHGQMTERQMEQTIRRFVRGEIDVLVSTTIVENGLDIPNANTILIDRPELFGLAELHQLRGRVGRSSAPAFCLLLLDRERPPGEEGKRRLKALEELSQLGAGFAIAIKDLEIRGAGNLLGPQQSGHIAAVGYDMYCQLLRAAVDAAERRQPALPPPVREVDVDLRLQAFVPDTLVADPRQRLELLREMDGAVDEEQRQRIEQALRDRFGKLPVPLLTLLDVFLLKHLLAGQGVTSVQWTGADRVVVGHPRGEPLGGAWLDAFLDVRQVEAGKTHLLLRRPFSAERALQALLAALLGRAPPARIPRR
jgi:transcription-repair coupling factor (superfamily II helicase)